jgi:hypothetical protein
MDWITPPAAPVNSTLANRHQRRALAKASRAKLVIPRVTKIHEAGHALGRLLVVRELGHEIERAIHSIVFEADLATTYGPALTREMEEQMKESDEFRLEQIGRVCDGLDLKHWARIKLFEGAMGPASEARFSGVPLDFDLLSGPHCGDDFKDMVRHTKAAGLGVATDLMNTACILANSVIHNAGYWAAIERLANVLPDRGGSFDGKKAIEILSVEPWEAGTLKQYADKIEQRMALRGGAAVG